MKTFSRVRVEIGQRDTEEKSPLMEEEWTVGREASVLSSMFRPAYRYFLKFQEQTTSLRKYFPILMTGRPVLINSLFFTRKPPGA